ncbi:dinuclear metal center YbgI/SA1388 family protein [Ruminiclostridium sufflavum DSM 19573]|uniref:GTP cyclohydrolase 1 type 2 homolog n=1 Tax=Ruminiclostridium sufflavum DSM 19573 TaxID=1121337 RepID=A0A318XN66_9FIRM|nr:Nif3-like dinuclear metal center hexameric protein [Ruminiclostridium sufflavum]PYG87029.1 dinuclear metal center YbgI/SA1388 family protein [Ruminiclostridium sufflavum DSM 19573]
MNTGEILDFINELAPFKYAEAWDNVGLMVGSRKCSVNKILLCMDVTEKVVEESIDKEANLIISHHPFLFSKLKSVDFDTMTGQQISRLIKNDINVISAHTNLDVAEGGVNDTLAEAVGLTECTNLKPYIPEGFEIDLGLGKAGRLSRELSFDEFICSIKKKLNIQNLRITGTQPKTVRRAATFCGSFDGDLDSIRQQDVDVLITGDVKYHTALAARELGLCVIDAGHFASEHLIVNKLKSLLENNFTGIEILCSTMEGDPFIFA